MTCVNSVRDGKVKSQEQEQLKKAGLVVIQVTLQIKGRNDSAEKGKKKERTKRISHDKWKKTKKIQQKKAQVKW